MQTAIHAYMCNTIPYTQNTYMYTIPTHVTYLLHTHELRNKTGNVFETIMSGWKSCDLWLHNILNLDILMINAMEESDTCKYKICVIQVQSSVMDQFTKISVLEMIRVWNYNKHVKMDGSQILLKYFGGNKHHSGVVLQRNVHSVVGALFQS